MRDEWRRAAHPAVSTRRGHASTRLTLDTYSHVMPAMSDAAVRASAALFEKPVPPKTRPKVARENAPKHPLERVQTPRRTLAGHPVMENALKRPGHGRARRRRARAWVTMRDE